MWQDLRLSLGLAESVSQSTPIAAAANELYKVAKSHGFSDQDFSAVIEALKSKFQQSEDHWSSYGIQVQVGNGSKFGDLRSSIDRM